MKLGDLAKDKLTGFEGVVTTVQRHLTGCNTMWLTSRTLTTPEGKAIERAFDVLRLELIESQVVSIPRLPESADAG